MLWLVVALYAWPSSSRPAPKTIVDESALPELETVLSEVGIGEHVAAMQLRGLDRTRQLLKWGRSDVQLLCVEFNLTQATGAALLARIDELRARAVSRPEPEAVDELRELKRQRERLSYGRLQVSRSTASFDYKKAWFGAGLTYDELALVRALPVDACKPLAGDVSGKAVLAERGTCQFVDKAWHAHHAGAAALIVINGVEAAFDRPASGYATDATETPTPDDLAVVLADASAGPALRHVAAAPLINATLARAHRKIVDRATVAGIDSSDAVNVRFVPVECRAGDPDCKPLLPDERALAPFVDSGHLLVKNQSFEFVTAVWGGVLPARPIPVVLADPPDLCTPPPHWLCRLVGVGCPGASSFVARARAAIVLAERGNCNFSTKAAHAAALSAAALVVSNLNDEPLLRMGIRGTPPPAVPAVLVESQARVAIRAAVEADEAVLAMLAPAEPGFSRQWLELHDIAADWPSDRAAADLQLRRLENRNHDSPTRLAWLRRSFALRHTCYSGNDESSACAAAP